MELTTLQRLTLITALDCYRDYLDSQHPGPQDATFDAWCKEELVMIAEIRAILEQAEEVSE